MASTEPLADPSDVADVWRPLTDAETDRVASLITKASARLRQQCPFDIDARMALFSTNPTAPTALNPVIVADTVATIVKRFLVNTDGAATVSDGVGPYSHSATYVNRYDKTGSDVRGAIQITPSDIDQLRPAVPAVVPSTFRVRTPVPRVMLPRGYVGTRLGPVVIPDVQYGPNPDQPFEDPNGTAS